MSVILLKEEKRGRKETESFNSYQACEQAHTLEEDTRKVCDIIKIYAPNC
jgi:hypothetical protein